ncbi:MAG: M55 family metallopeptidase [Candidatus Marinimicrobia bacterium]|jgi:D-amino peptidase|uniref:Amino acid amidase n=1 Tax=marine metagenome TaxID=408172 RepID=A0A381ZGK1_9ZZZZ|nr:M55 family metallopeptidase [Candidatus Neomarinimicrobiota bacterium]MDP6400740.1 M55 family metallopeptidase [Candidatus Neomarinimicrobiota bacterium]MDP6861934.1 M55 family metallopeptidase [Candidatus Neomarinimicrobiota bacterium]MDP7272110.1 M55 family metallopeptidase [Candidatus Neomarinimicrobiota bacterium]MEC7731516.1 M55 family metallopeptidase [Candidatus Neomarinimicrobiota bacterium]|tara:strand:+ start:88 stop:888 length:801 start_codon:yes stop_codon:yes gene_type:complete
MKIYISADMEGITGVTHWDEVDHNKSSYGQFQKQMSLEVAAACEGALEAGAKEIWVKDAHYSGRNILAEILPKGVKLIRGWSGHPYSMVQELDDSFDALMMVGYHSRAGQGGNPLAHTLSSSKLDSITINDRQTSEFFLHGNIAAKHGVPLVFLSGDVGLCEEVLEVSPGTTTVATMVGVGDSTISIQPQESLEAIKTKVKSALSGELSNCLWDHPKSFVVHIRFNKQQLAYRASHYPGAELFDPKTIAFTTKEYDEVMQLILFVV